RRAVRGRAVQGRGAQGFGPAGWPGPPVDAPPGLAGAPGPAPGALPAVAPGPGRRLPPAASLGWRIRVTVAGDPLEHLGPERPLALQLAQHSNALGGDAMDEHVLGRQVEAAAQVGRTRVGHPGRLPAQPVAAELAS